MKFNRTITAQFFTALTTVILAGCASAPTATSPGRLKPSADGRSLQWENGTRFFLHADTAWILAYGYSDQEVQEYLDKRLGQKFNTLLLSAVFGVNQADRAEFYKQAFADGDVTKPIEPYWRRLDWVIDQATRRGFVVALNPIWKNNLNDFLQANGPEKCRTFGQWIARRYQNDPRVIYVIGGDQVPEPTRDEMDALGRGIQEVYGGKAIVAYHSRADQSSLEAFPNASWLTVNWTYSYSPPYRRRYPYEINQENYRERKNLPLQFCEGYYDFGPDTHASTNGTRGRWADRFVLRRQAWWGSVLTGASGYAYGAEPIWLHNRGTQTWQQALGYESAGDMTQLKHFVDGVRWWLLEPDADHAFLINGYGEWRTDDFAVAAVASDGSFAAVYTPISRSFELQLDRLRPGKITARWFDPANGEFRSIEAPLWANRGRVTIRSPDANSAGQGDFVLLLTVWQ